MITHSTALWDWVIVLPVLLGLFGAGLLLVLRTQVRLQAMACAAICLLILLSDVALVQRVLESGPLAMTMGKWLPPFGITFAADLLGAVFALVAALVTLIVLLYLQARTPEHAVRDGVYPLILLLLAGISGGFLTGDMFNLYVWFEVALISTFGLMVMAGNPIQLDAAVKYGLLNFVATTLFLAALGLLYGLFGTLNMADLIARQATVDRGALVAIAALFMLSLGIKAAAFPVNAWLPASYHAMPPGLSALMAGLLTKLALYALIRTLIFVLPASFETLQPVFLVVAIATMILGPLGAIAESHVRRSLGFILIGGIGVTLAGVAMPSAGSMAGSILYIVHAMLTVTALYLLAGFAEGVGDDVSQRRGLKGAAAAAFLLVVLSVSGVPPFLGFWPKLLLLKGIIGQSGIIHGVSADAQAIILAGGILLNAFLTLIAGSRLWISLAWRREAATAAPVPQLASALTLSAVVLAAGLLPNALIGFAQTAAAEILNPSSYIAAVGLAP